MKKCLTSILILLCMTLALVPTTAFADGGEVEINETNFPDAAFRQIVTSFDTDGNGILSEAEISNVTEIRCGDALSGDESLSDLTGIEHFLALETLNCSGNQLTALDVSKNAKLQILDCSDNQLTALDVSKNTALTVLFCGINHDLTRLDVSQNENLKALYCGATGLEALDVSHNTALETLHCGSALIKVLDVSHNPTLETLDCSNNTLAELNLSGNPALTTLDCSGNALNALDLHANTALAYLTCSYLPLTELDLSSNPALTTFQCESSNLAGLDVSKNTALAGFECDGNFYSITVGADRTFDLSALPSCFDVTKASNWEGGTVSGNLLTVQPGVEAVTYTYDCGNGHSAVFALPVTASESAATNPAASSTDTNTDSNGIPTSRILLFSLIGIVLIVAAIIIIKKNKPTKQ